MPDRPPPTSYRDEHELFHPGPGSEGYAAHLGDCLSCWRGFRDALKRGERWAASSGIVARLAAAPPTMPIAGPGMPREQQALVQLKPQHIGPCAVAVGGLSCALASVLPWWLAAPALGVLLVLLVVLGRRVELDRTPPARLLRR